MQVAQQSNVQNAAFTIEKTGGLFPVVLLGLHAPIVPRSLRYANVNANGLPRKSVTINLTTTCVSTDVQHCNITIQDVCEPALSHAENIHTCTARG
jgi:hypothetical protein